MEQSKAISLAKKLQELANRGVGGEASNAKLLLDKLVAAHNITLDDLEQEERHWCEYDIALKHQDLFWSIVFNVICDFDGTYKQSSRSKRKISLNLTYAEQLELTAKFDHYVRNYDKQLAMFANAFIYKHKLFPNRTPEYQAKLDAKRSRNRMSNDDASLLYSLAHGIVRSDYQNRIEDMSKLLTD